MSEFQGISENILLRQPHNDGMKSMVTALESFDNVIPSDGLYEWNKEGKRIDRGRLFSSQSTLASIGDVITNKFSDSEDRDSVVVAASKFINGLRSDLILNKFEDVSALSDIDRFLAEFPSNIIDGLGEKASSELVVKILNIGSNAIERFMQKPVDNRRIWQNLQYGIIARLVGSSIPEVIGKSNDSQATLELIEKEFESKDITKAADYIDYFLEHKPVSENQVKRVEDLDTSASHLIAEENSGSEFDSDPVPWSKDRIMGKEVRAPKWRDLVMLVRRGELDRREFGLVLMDTGKNKSLIQYMRGGEVNVFNGPQEIRDAASVFFHNHPGTESDEVSPLISNGDFQGSDAGGGYMNIACLSGVTLHTGSELLDESIQDDLRSKFGMRPLYVLESGVEKGKVIASDNEFSETVRVMQEIRNENYPGPFSYSVSHQALGLKYFFVHIPWGKIDPSIELTDVCFGNSLPDLIKSIGSDLALPVSANLVDALVGDHVLRDKIFSKKLLAEERDFEDITDK